MSTQSITPEQNQTLSDISPRLKRKLDKHLATRDNKVGGRRIGAGRKPLHEKHLSRNTAAKLFHELSIKDECARLLESADLRLRFEVIRYLWDRLEGKPFTAINPAESKQAATVNNDNRLQNAIINLIPGSPKPKARKAKLLTAEATVVSTDAAASPNVIIDLPADHD